MNEEDMSFIANPKGIDYVKAINEVSPPKEQAALMQLLNLKDPALRDIIRPMVELNPYFRPSAKELLKNKYFDEVRVPEFEHSSRQKLSLELDSD